MSIPNKKELLKIADDVESGMKAFNKKKAEFKTLKSDAAKITIANIEDKPAIKAAGILRKKLKAARCEITRQGKDLRQPLTNLAFLISEREKELIEIIEPAEKELQRQELWVASEQQKIEQAEHERKNAIINDRINRLADYGFAVDTEILASIDDETFDAVLEQARIQFESNPTPAKSSVDPTDALIKNVDAIMTDEKSKIDSDDRRVMVDLNAALSLAINQNPTMFEERKLLVMYAMKVHELMDIHTPKMQTIEGRDIVTTANELLIQVHLMLLDAVEQM